MFTCCPNCETVFKVSAKHLQQAAGQVRCGHCEFSFNALSNIQESASEAAANLPAPADRGEDADAPLDDLTAAAVDDLDAAGGGQTATPDEVVLVEDAEAFEAAVLATIHATESKAWESSGPHFVGNVDDADATPDEPGDDQPVRAELMEGDDERTENEPAEDAPDTDEDDAWLSSEAQDTDLDADPDRPSMDFLERLAEGADEEAGLEDINVDDEDESQELAHDDLLEGQDVGESAEADDDSPPENDEPDKPESLADDELLENEGTGESAQVIDDEHDDEPATPPAEEPGEEESATKDSGQEADEGSVEHAAGDADSGVEEIWLGEVTLESAEKDELEFDVPSDQVDTVFVAADEEPPASETAAGTDDGSESESLEEFLDSHTEGAEEIVLATDEALDFSVAEPTLESPSTPAAAKNRRFTLAKKYHRPAAIAVVIALAFLLPAQLTHYFRYQILASDSFGPLLESVYSGLGIPLTRQWDLDAYDIRRTRVVANEAGTGVVEISAILTNRATFAQPYPILRLIFTDQWDEALAIRDLYAGEYLETDPGDQARMAAGEQVAVDIRVMELTNDLAQNYHIEYCLQDSDQNLRCK
ncbi:MAG: DUF3426 domain-containing protein [Gammaproteobacteria bacterium]|nr:DUF3426 domain-containing protein [Gammaproteobacteria bacterium]MCZ6880143.1 DUF3426 domain-containing protein [Gammaproteobacteria bacterium]